MTFVPFILITQSKAEPTLPSAGRRRSAALSAAWLTNTGFNIYVYIYMLSEGVRLETRVPGVDYYYTDVQVMGTGKGRLHQRYAADARPVEELEPGACGS